MTDTSLARTLKNGEWPAYWPCDPPARLIAVAANLMLATCAEELKLALTLSWFHLRSVPFPPEGETVSIPYEVGLLNIDVDPYRFNMGGRTSAAAPGVVFINAEWSTYMTILSVAHEARHQQQLVLGWDFSHGQRSPAEQDAKIYAAGKRKLARLLIRAAKEHVRIGRRAAAGPA